MKYFLMLAILLAGCDSQPQPMTQHLDGRLIPEIIGREYCYRGVVYVAFHNYTQMVWGGVKLTPSGQTEICKLL